MLPNFSVWDKILLVKSLIIEEIVKEVSAKDAPIMNNNTMAEKVAENNYNDPNVDLSKAYVISPALVDEVKAIHESKRDTNDVFDTIDQQAEYQGGMNAFVNFLQENIKYPASAQKANISGKVYTQFIVNTDGTISNVTTLKSVGYGCDEEAIRVLKLAKWTPGKQNGRVVRSRFTVPINFQLGKESKIKIDKNEQEELPKLPAVMEFKWDREETVSTNIVMKCNDCPPPLYIVDGVEHSSDNIKNLNSNDIQSVSILNDIKAVAEYGEKGKNGVILITSKKK
jgi:TonB family protein